jgi:hypothetical protein
LDGGGTTTQKTDAQECRKKAKKAQSQCFASRFQTKYGSGPVHDSKRIKLANSTADFTSIFSNTLARWTSTVRTLMSS